jgi:hypothetical protein
VFEDSPSVTLRIIGRISAIWFYGHGWYAPIYYGALFFLGTWIDDKFELGWRGSKPIWSFVFGVSGAYGAFCAALICTPLILMTAHGGLNPIFMTLVAVNIFAFQALVRSVVSTCKNEADKSWRLLKQGLFAFAPSMALLFLFASSFSNMH